MERRQETASKAGASLFKKVVQVLSFYAPVCLPFRSYVGSCEPFFFDPLIYSFGIDLKLLRYLLYSKYLCHNVCSFDPEWVITESIPCGSDFVHIGLDFYFIWFYTPIK